ncbi:hypothetical protein [Altererythrobacter sp. GH1-8]|uniref:hypothetical protein n=1 Tax=Altererythrobacter sp. GH1-8 TaxID=3349333 RepID=UPI00374DB3A2
MRRTFLLPLLFLCAFSTQSLAQSDQSPQSTTATTDSRFEIVQSELAARWTFRLDKKCGNVAQLVSTETSSVAWQEMIVLFLPDCLASNKPRYQIFTSGLAARHTFLIDSQTGKTWILIQSGETTYWGPFEE